MALMEIRWPRRNIASVRSVTYLAAALTIEGSALELVGDACGLLEIDEFRPGLLSALRRAVPSDWASLNEVGPEPTDTFSIIEPSLEHRWHKVWRSHGDENPLVAYYRRTKDGRPYRFSDFVSQDELHSLDLYREFYGPIGLEHQIAFLLPAVSGAILGVALSRRERDFTDTERDLLGLARPHLIQAYNNALRYSQTLRGDEGVRSIARGRVERLREAGLTARESEVLVLAASGSSDREIAEILGIGPRTVEKHLQRSYAKLRIEGRSQATSFVDDLERKHRLT
jgi:DNA-binding CsgD family transcriptional regulator